MPAAEPVVERASYTSHRNRKTDSLSVHQTVRSMSMLGSLLLLDQTSWATLPFSRVRMD